MCIMKVQHKAVHVRKLVFAGSAQYVLLTVPVTHGECQLYGNCHCWRGVGQPHKLMTLWHTSPALAQPPLVANTITLAASTATGDCTAAYGIEITHQHQMHNCSMNICITTCMSAPWTYDISSASTATTSHQHNHQWLHCHLWYRNNSPTSDAWTSVSQHIIINIHTIIPHGTDTATAGDILTYPQCHTTASTATSDYTSNPLVIHTSMTTHTLPSRHWHPLFHTSLTHHQHSHQQLQQHATTCTPAATSLILLPLWPHPSTTNIALLMQYLPFMWPCLMQPS
jgi:hypothetical protein